MNCRGVRVTANVGRVEHEHRCGDAERAMRATASYR